MGVRVDGAEIPSGSTLADAGLGAGSTVLLVDNNAAAPVAARKYGIRGRSVWIKPRKPAILKGWKQRLKKWGDTTWWFKAPYERCFLITLQSCNPNCNW